MPPKGAADRAGVGVERGEARGGGVPELGRAAGESTCVAAVAGEHSMDAAAGDGTDGEAHRAGERRRW